MCRNFDLVNKSHLFPPSDICFGEWYQQRSIMSTNKITLVVHTDGAPLIRSSKQSTWPCFTSITELPPPVREFQSNIIILALWTSKMKPNVNIFLDQTINDLLFLIKNAASIFINDHEYKIQLNTQLFLSDLPAKSLFCCTTSFNGYSAVTRRFRALHFRADISAQTFQRTTFSRTNIPRMTLSRYDINALTR